MQGLGEIVPMGGLSRQLQKEIAQAYISGFRVRLIPGLDFRLAQACNPNLKSEHPSLKSKPEICLSSEPAMQ